MFQDVINCFYDLPTNSTLAGIKVFPADYKGELPVPPFLKLNIVFTPTARVAYSGSKRVAGSVILSIYSTSGQGQLFASGVAGQLNDIFEQKLLEFGIQTKESSIQFLGTDPKDASLSRADYSVPFTFYGE